MENQSTNLEAKSLDVHVALCSERYKTLEDKLNKLEERSNRIEGMVEGLRDDMVDLKDHIHQESQKHSLREVDKEADRSALLSKILTYIVVAFISVITTVLVYNFDRLDRHNENTQSTYSQEHGKKQDQGNGSKEIHVPSTIISPIAD